MATRWHTIEPVTTGVQLVENLPGVRIEALPVFGDARGTLHELFRVDETPAGFQPLMACTSWTSPGITRGPHEHVGQDDYFTFAGPSAFLVALWDARPGGKGGEEAWLLKTGEPFPSRIYIPHGVVHAYRNVGEKPGLGVNVANMVMPGPGRKGPVDEIRHELNPSSPFQFEQFQTL